MTKDFDIQVNGYAGVDFCSPYLTIEECRLACDELSKDGVGGILATVITDSIDGICRKLARIAAYRDIDPVIARMIVGFHVEGPFLNPAQGYIGAHSISHVTLANVGAMDRIVDSSAGLLRLVTLAPECDPGFATTSFLARRAITVAAGHCNPTLVQLQGAIDAGLSMVTHLGNGCPVTLPRHDNIIQRILSLHDQLWVCYIPDGVHLPYFALANYLAVTGLQRSIMVTDAISAAKLGPGIHELSGAPVEVDAAGVARRPGSMNLAGSTVTMPQVRKNLAQYLGFSTAEIALLVDINPRRAIGLA